MISCSKENTVEPALEDDSQSDFELINDETDDILVDYSEVVPNINPSMEFK